MARNLQPDFQGSCDAAPTPEMGTDPQLMKSTGSQKFFASSKSPVGHGVLKRAGCSAGKGLTQDHYHPILHLLSAVTVHSQERKGKEW